jgi:ubiquinone/menaquinone biosynthesis C-methylase UbiE
MNELRLERPTHEWVSAYYGKLLASTADLKTNACCASGPPPLWLAAAIERVHPEVADRFYGCGYPVPHAIEGCTVLDLGCGTGRDAFVLAELVGASGRVIGVDMTAEQLDVARKWEAWHAAQNGYVAPNTSFRLGYIEDLAALDVADESVDVIVSNCVVNLSPRKDLVLAEAFRVLKPGGEFYFSDVFADRRLPEAVATDPELYGECLGGALYDFDFATLARQTGFKDPRKMVSSPITIANASVAQRVGAAQFRSITWRLLKLDALDEQCEDYGQIVVYRGGIPGAETLFWLDDHHAFERGRPERVCWNTASMIARTRFARFFDVFGSRDTHYGAYPCGPTLAAAQYQAVPSGSAACGPGGCC